LLVEGGGGGRYGLANYYCTVNWDLVDHIQITV